MPHDPQRTRQTNLAHRGSNRGLLAVPWISKAERGVWMSMSEEHRRLINHVRIRQLRAEAGMQAILIFLWGLFVFGMVIGALIALGAEQ
jgi:hypothetical protein